jgi:hypothetical protein
LQGDLYYPRWATGGRLVKVQPSNVDAYIGKQLRQAQIIEASNVADFYHSRSGQSNWDSPHDFPNVAPPFPLFWIEMRCPTQLSPTDSLERSDGCLPFGFGCLVETWQGESGRRALQQAPGFSPSAEIEGLMDEFSPIFKSSLAEKERRYGKGRLWQHLAPEEKPYFMLVGMYQDAAQGNTYYRTFPMMVGLVSWMF